MRGGKRKGAGRPAMSGKMVHLHVKIPEDLRDAAIKQAKRDDAPTLSAWVRLIIENNCPNFRQ